MSDPILYSLPRQNNYETARALAAEKLAALDFEEQCAKAGLTPGPDGALLKFIDRKYFLDRKSLRLSTIDPGPPVEIWEEIVILHYLAQATGQDPQGELISYQQVPDGAPYYSTFLKRTSQILIARFGEKPDDLLARAEQLGGHAVRDLGDLAVSVPALPRIEFIFICWKGDSEFPPDIRILFDHSITSCLPAEDITVLAQMICLKMVKG